MQTMNIHGVARVELASHFPTNSNSRSLRIVTDDGHEFTITLFGETDALAALVKADDYRVIEPIDIFASEAA